MKSAMRDNQMHRSERFYAPYTRGSARYSKQSREILADLEPAMDGLRTLWNHFGK